MMREDLPAGVVSERGFTVVEGLVATAILLIVAIGVLPLFTNAILNNSRGADSTTASNFGKTTIENLSQQQFNSTDLTITSGTQKTTNEWWKPGAGPINDSTQGWQTTAPSASTFTTWTRITSVQQYGVRDILNSQVAAPGSLQGVLSTPLASGTQPNFVQLKLITVTVQSSKLNTVTALGGGKQGAVLGGGEAIVLQMVKAL
ncbi:MAG TPA: type II secretion system protein [Thermoanaerobaculia bacterium]|nr:type II secretion system protein [Thermoanaerobaculia bacterium]